MEENKKKSWFESWFPKSPLKKPKAPRDDDYQKMIDNAHASGDTNLYHFNDLVKYHPNHQAFLDKMKQTVEERLNDRKLYGKALDDLIGDHIKQPKYLSKLDLKKLPVEKQEEYRNQMKAYRLKRKLLAEIKEDNRTQKRVAKKAARKLAEKNGQTEEE